MPLKKVPFKHKIFQSRRLKVMARRKKKSTFQKITIFMALLMALITLLGVLFQTLSVAGML